MDMNPNYASPNVRWALLLEDYPGATYDFRLGKASEFGTPPEFGGDQDVIVCTIVFPPSSGKSPAVGWKEIVDQKGNVVPVDKRDPALWNLLSTKALGRAAKRSGYPDSLPELKALVLWRQRLAEIAAIGSGVAPVAALPPAPVEEALDAAAVPDPETVGPPPNVDADTGEVHDGDASFDYDEVLADYRALVGSLGPKQAEFKAWCKTEQINFPAPKRDDLRRAVRRAMDVRDDIEDAQVVE